MTISGITSLIATIVVGGAIGTASIVGLVSSQTAAPSQSPVNVEQPTIDYGARS